MGIAYNEEIGFETVLTSADCAVLFCDATPAGPAIRSVNAAFTALTGYSAAEAYGHNPSLLSGSATDPAVVAEIRASLRAGIAVCRDVTSHRKDGRPFRCQLTIMPIRGESGDVSSYVGLVVERAPGPASALEDGPEPQLPTVLEELPGYVYRLVSRADGRFETTFLSPSVSQFVGPEAQADPRLFERHVHPDDLGALISALEMSARTLGRMGVEFRLVAPNGAVRWMRSATQPMRQSNGDVVWDGLALDVTAEKAAALETSGHGVHDPLTGLANRETFRNRLREAIGRASLDQPLAVFCLDLDGFQDINETHGEAAGDAVLREIGRRLSRFAPAARGSVARIGGDEFALLTPLPSQAGSVEQTAEALCRIFAPPVCVAGADLAVRGSVGGTVHPAPASIHPPAAGDLADELMKRADLARHAAKQDDLGAFRLYDDHIDHRRRNRVALRQSMTQAIAGEQFELHYQPFVSIDSGAIAGAEALVRWNHPALGMQNPESFIPMAEASGLIVPLGDWILRQALQQGAAWTRQGLEVGRIAINLSSVQLRRRSQRPDFLLSVEAALEDTGADPRGFEFELTEGTIVESTEETMAILRSLKAMGFAIAIDDFGTGHASFRYLRDLLFDKVKVDRSFVCGIGQDGESEAIVAAMIRLTRMLGASVVGEGVESTVHRNFLYEQGCEFGQGYLFSPAVSATAFAALMRHGASLPGPRGAGAFGGA